MWARMAVICVLAHAGSSLANIAEPVAGSADIGDVSPSRSESGVARSLPAALRARITFAAGNSRGGDAQGKGQSRARAATVRSRAPVIIASTTGPGQSGYVHFFVIDTPDGDRETQIGMEMPDGRIAWSFPELGVVVSPFIESGEMLVEGRIYKVRHQYGIRPFPDDGSMLALQRDFLLRVIPWVEDGTPYCNLKEQSAQWCMSCLGFVMRVLYPGRSPLSPPALPPDFERAASGPYVSTEDLLLYLTGMHGLRSREARLRRISRLSLPQSLREELLALVGPGDPAADVSRDLSGKNRSGARSYSNSGQQRPAPRKKL